MKHEELEQSFLQLARVVLAQSRPFQPSDLPGAKPYSRAILQNAGELLRGFPAVEACARLHFDEHVVPRPQMSDNEGRPIDDPTFDQSGWVIVHALQSAVGETVERVKGLDPADSDLLETYRVYLRSWASGEIMWSARILLVRLQSLIPRTQLSDLLFIEPVPEEKAGDISLRSYLGLDLGVWVQPSSHQLVASLSAKRGENVNAKRDLVEAEVRRALTAMRLHKAGAVGKQLTAWSTDEKGTVAGGFATHSRIPVSEYREADYQLGPDDVLPIQSLMNSLRALEARGSSELDFALRRFNSCYGRSDDEDRVVDVATALESCLVPAQSERPFAAGLFAAALLRARYDADEVRRVARAVFIARNKIVHGSGLTSADLQKQLKRERLTATEVVALSEELLRQVLKVLVQEAPRSGSLNALRARLETGFVTSPLGTPRLPGLPA